MNKELIKIGQLAKEAKTTISEIKFYTQKGLLKPDGYTPGRHRLYDREKSLKEIKKIKIFQKEAKKFQLKNIKKTIRSEKMGIQSLSQLDLSEIQKVFQNITSHFCNAKIELRNYKKLGGFCSADKKTIRIINHSNSDLMLYCLFHEIYHVKYPDPYRENITQKMEKLMEKWGKNYKGKIDSELPKELTKEIKETFAKITEFNWRQEHPSDHPIEYHEDSANKWATQKFFYYLEHPDKFRVISSTKGKYWNKTK